MLFGFGSFVLVYVCGMIRDAHLHFFQWSACPRWTRQSFFNSHSVLPDHGWAEAWPWRNLPLLLPVIYQSIEKSICFLPSTKVEKESVFCVCVFVHSKANKSLKQTFSNNSFSWQNFLCLLLAEGHCNSCNNRGKDLLVETVYFKFLFVLPPL